MLCLKLFLLLTQSLQVLFKYLILLVKLFLQLGSLGLFTACHAPQIGNHRLKMSLQALGCGFLINDFLRGLTTFLGFVHGRSKHLDLFVGVKFSVRMFTPSTHQPVTRSRFTLSALPSLLSSSNLTASWPVVYSRCSASGIMFSTPIILVYCYVYIFYHYLNILFIQSNTFLF